MRLARGRDGVVVVDATGRAPGRGAYVCDEAMCLTRGLRPERLAHAFRARCQVTPGLAEAVQAARAARDVEARAR